MNKKDLQEMILEFIIKDMSRPAVKMGHGILIPTMSGPDFILSISCEPPIIRILEDNDWPNSRPRTLLAEIDLRHPDSLDQLKHDLERLEGLREYTSYLRRRANGELH